MPANIPPMQVLAILVATFAIGHDLYARRIPNGIVLGALFGSMVWQVAVTLFSAQPATPGLVEGTLALALALAVMLPFYAIGWMGAGDVKLMAVLGFLLGLKPLLIVWLVANALVAAQTLLIFALRFATSHQPQLAMWQTSWQHSAFCQSIERPRQGRRGMPFAAYLGIGVFVYVFCSPFMELMQ